MEAAFGPVTPHIFKLDLPLFGGVMRVGVWLVRGDDDWTLVDTGSPGDAATIVRATLTHTGGQPPARIVLTHGHYDHAGSLRALQERWSVPVLAHAAENPFLTGKAGYGAARPIWWGNRLLHLLGPLAGRTAPARVTDALGEGDLVGGLEVRHVPGHTPGMIALIHRADRAIVAGDTFISHHGRLGPPFKLFTADPAEARRSMRKLAQEDFDHLLASHGSPILGTGKREAERAANGLA